MLNALDISSTEQTPDDLADMLTTFFAELNTPAPAHPPVQVVGQPHESRVLQLLAPSWLASYAPSGVTVPLPCRVAVELMRLGGALAQSSATRMIVLP